MEEQVSHISELEGLNAEMDGFLSGLKGREEDYASRIAALEEELGRLRQESGFTERLLLETKASLQSESAKAGELALERVSLVQKLEELARLLNEEKVVSAEKALFINSARSALKDTEAEANKVWRAMEELKAELAFERAAVNEREAKAQKFSKISESLELRMRQSLEESARAEEGFSEKIELLRKELREQVRRSEDLERRLSSAGTRLDEILEEAARKEKQFAEALSLLAGRDALLKAAEQKAAGLEKELAGFKDGAGRKREERGRELAASLSARVEELEAALSENAVQSLEKFRASQEALNAANAALRGKEEENASIAARESSLLKELAGAEEKWKLAAAQLHNAVARIRAAENDNEINAAKLKTLEEERNKFRAAAIKAEVAASSMVSREARARDGEAAGLVEALEQQSAAYTAMLRKYDDLVLANEALAREKAGAEAESESFKAGLKNMESGVSAAAGAEKVRYAALAEKLRSSEALLKNKEYELEEARAALSGLENECSLLRRSREELGQKFFREIEAENELLQSAQARVIERDEVIARLSTVEEELKKEAEALKKDKAALLSLVRKKSAPPNAVKVSETERLLADKESRLIKLRAELEKTRIEKAELQGREKDLRDELKVKPYRAMLREAEEKLLIKEKMLAGMNFRMEKIGRDFEELKGRGQAAGGPGYLPDFEELVAGVAHQVANSISIIRSHAEFCSEAPEAAGAKESLAVIVRNIVALQKKIDTIINFSRPVIPQLSPERLAAVASEVLDGLRAAGKLKGVRIALSGGENLPPVNLDRVRLTAALEQLLLNAAEAMPGGGELDVKVSASEGKQRFEISDTGEGIEKKNLTAVFHPFFTTRPGKMGLGLTLARNVVRAHGGTLELVGEPGRGTRAVMEFPAG